MATPNVPEYSVPSSRSQTASIGVVQNIGSATGGLNIGGFANNSKGGEVDTGTASFNTFPKNQATTAAVNIGGAGQGSSLESSSNPATPQTNVAIVSTQNNDTENRAQTNTANVSSMSAGYHTDYPATNKDAEYSKVNGFTTLGNPKEDYRGITHNRTFSINNDLVRNSANRLDVIAAKEDEKVDGAGQGANSADKYKAALGDTVQTASMNTLPGGHEISTEVGNN